MRATEFIVEDNADYDEDRFLKSDPGTPLNFPKGTTLVNVSDVYDWYKLGMAVSDLDDADPRTFNRGVPHTVFAFGSEQEEHRMIPLLKRLGFSLHDIDSPKDYEKAIRASDVMEHLEEIAGGENKCPPAIQDITLNLKNRQKAIDEYGYGPLNPDMPNRKFWMKKVDEWNLDSIQEAQQSLCGNCAAFDIRQETLDCIAQGIDSGNPEDAKGVIDAGDLGYCKFLKFKCASRRTCDAWVTGGPLVDEQGMAEDLTEEFDLIESIIEGIAAQNGVDAEAVWADLESLTEDELYAFAVTSQLNEDWQKANKRDRTDGMSQKAVNAYRRENPGSKLKTAVTTKPSKLKKGGKASKRRKSYCSRSRGQMKMHSISCAKTPDKAICKARRRWNC